MIKITSDMKPDPEPKPWIEIDLKQFTLVNYDPLNGHTAEVRLSEEQAREIVNYMNENIWSS